MGHLANMPTSQQQRREQYGADTTGAQASTQQAHEPSRVPTTYCAVDECAEYAIAEYDSVPLCTQHEIHKDDGEVRRRVRAPLSANRTGAVLERLDPSISALAADAYRSVGVEDAWKAAEAQLEKRDVCWEVHLGDSWFPFDPHVSALLEKTRSEGRNEAHGVIVRGQSYTIQVSGGDSLKQRNERYGTQRPVRRCVCEDETKVSMVKAEAAFEADICRVSSLTDEAAEVNALKAACEADICRVSSLSDEPWHTAHTSAFGGNELQAIQNLVEAEKAAKAKSADAHAWLPWWAREDYDSCALVRSLSTIEAELEALEVEHDLDLVPEQYYLTHRAELLELKAECTIVSPDLAALA